MKKFLSFMLIFCMLFCLISCQGDGDASADNASEISSTPTESETVSSSEPEQTGNNENGQTVELKAVDPLEGFTAPATAEITFEGKTYTKYYADDISLFKYCGTWQADEDDPHTMVTYWTTNYVEVDFTGGEILLDLTDTSTFQLRVDNGDYKAVSHKGIYKLTVSDGGTHTVRIYSRGNRNRVYFGGAAVPEGGTLSRTAKKGYYVQFVGDSITNGNSYLTPLADMVGCDHSVVSVGSIALRSGYGGIAKLSPKMVELMGEEKVRVGMEVGFFKLEIPSDTIKTEEEMQRYTKYHEDEYFDYDFKTGYYPDAVFIFLGTNDALKYESMEDFSTRYNEFVGKILSIYGKDTKVYIMQALSGSDARYTCIEAAANRIVVNYPDNAVFVDTATVKGWNIELADDGVHPTTAGYEALATQIFGYLNNN